MMMTQSINSAKRRQGGEILVPFNGLFVHLFFKTDLNHFIFLVVFDRNRVSVDNNILL